ncbi:DUF1840 domain-containing protein [Simplicispira psychrophila]|uniref:DUF1840 domain-containing protein n=1 Tax=Simplicispira psychrophila TaxID=80882 RepID=UPI00047F57FA|nr:DUF1840 domain-containing protein [Simplicispira psychrophila]
MLYKFKSRSTADLILLEPHGRRLLQIIGKETGRAGIVTVAQIPAAVAALEAAVLDEERRAAAAQAQAKEAHTNAQADDAAEEGPQGDSDVVSLRQRAAPFIDMLRRSAQGGDDVVWGT